MTSLKTFLMAILTIILFQSSIFGYTEDSAMVEMRDSIALATQIYLPEYRPPPYPVVLERTPYNRHAGDMAIIICDLYGFAYVTQNVRGMRDSEGEPMVFLTDGWGEIKDGYDCIDWISEQSWCNGKIGMMGASAPGMTQYMAAGAMHPNLTMICPIMAGPSMYHHVAYQGGVFREVLVENWLEGIHTPWLIDTVTNHPVYDSMWAQVDLTTKYDSVTIPTYHVTGWYDMYTDGQIEAFQRMNEVNGNNKLFIAACGHGEAVGTLEQGDLVYPPNALRTEDDLLNIAFRWYDHWLHESPTGIMDEPAVQYYLTGDCDTDDTTFFNRWRFAETWPPEGTEYVEFYIHGDGTMDTIPPSVVESDSFLYDPEDPSPTIGGREFIGMDEIGYGPKDQSDIVESRSDVLIYSTPVLEHPVAVTGKIKMILFGESNRYDTDWTVRVTDVYPDGRSILMTDGILRARFRHGLETEDLLEPGVPDTFEIDAWSIGHVFNSGHQIRVIVSSSNYPRFSVNPNTGAEIIPDDPVTLVATNTVHMSPEMPSHLLLPILPLDTTIIAETAHTPEDFAISAHPNPFNGAVTITVEQTFMSIQDDATGQTGMSGLPIEIEIFDMNGRKVDNITVGANLVFGQPSGDHKNHPCETVWQPDDNIPSGVYLVRACFESAQRKDGQTVTKRIVYLK